ncbi:hypothetical protein D779_0509 [Imhoffiella purpurea]|uniref:Uncharacterized protein n=1 Tax=Imhoffiella purpurea TaxID=1249627 RepID=W9V9S5_9GAMM|nr:hypothetical protein D779_0509 [Imhoffiella purpurea]
MIQALGAPAMNGGAFEHLDAGRMPDRHSTGDSPALNASLSRG